MIIVKPTTATNQAQNHIEEYRVEVKNGVEYFYKYCPVCGHETTWCPIQSYCE